MSQLADRTKLVKPSVTLAIAAKAGKLRASGIDVINFSAGEPDFDTPEHIKAAAVEALRKGMTKYTDVKGIEPLREAISEKYHREHDLSYRKEDILVSCGAKHSLYNLLQAVVNPGDEVVIPLELSVIVAVYTVLLTFRTIYCYYMNGVGKIMLQLYLVIISGIINIPLGIYLCKKLGVAGVLLSTTLLCVISAVFEITQYRKLISNTAKGIWNK